MDKIDRLGAGFAVLAGAVIVAMFVAAFAIMWKGSLIVIGILFASYGIGYIIDKKTELDPEFTGGDRYP